MSMENNNEDWEDIAFRSTFDATYISLEKRQAFDASFVLEDLERQLEDLYIWDGWAAGAGDRGRAGDINMQATIAAIQCKLYEWKHELSNTDSSKEK